MMMPLPPAKVSAMAPTRQSRASMPVYSARPPATPPRTLSVRLRRSGGRGAARRGLWGVGRGRGGGGGGGRGGGGGGAPPPVGSAVGGGAEGGSAEVMAEACRRRRPGGIREPPEPTLILAPDRELPGS